MNLVTLLPFLCSGCLGTHQMYQTSQVTSSGKLDCLPFVEIWETGSTLLETNANIQLNRFCRQVRSNSGTVTSALHDSELNVSGLRFTFERLRAMSVTASQLFQWSAPMDMIEDYELGENKGEFYNCSANADLWFGTKCEYNLDYDTDFSTFVMKRIDEKRDIGIDILTITNGTCYEIGNDRCTSVLCLDWREICDGKKTISYGLLVFSDREGILPKRIFCL